jgi:uncharacterized RDD family membrane protein YckC
MFSGEDDLPPPGFGPGDDDDYFPPLVVEHDLAGFWCRAAALVLDWLVVALFLIPAGLVFLLGPKRSTPCTVREKGGIGFNGEPNATCHVPTMATWLFVGLLLFGAAVAATLYFSLLEGGPSGQTLGKRVLGIRVVDTAGGGPIGTSRGVGRYLVRLASTLACGIGYLWMIFDSHRQTWHDKAVDSNVVKI